MYKSNSMNQIDNFQIELDPSFLDVFKSIREYLNTSGLNNLEKVECLNQILDTFLHSQKDGRQVDEVIGENHEKFCDSLISAYGAGPGWRSSGLLVLQCWLVLAICLKGVRWLLLGDWQIAALFEQGLYAGYMLMIFLFGISCALIPLFLRKSIFASPAEKRRYRYKQLLVTGTALLIVVMINESFIALRVFDPEVTIPILASPLMWVFFIAAAIVIQFLKKNLRTNKD